MPADSLQHFGDGPLVLFFGFIAFLGALYALYHRLLPQPLPGIPHNETSARKLLGDAPDMLREVRITRELNLWLVKQTNKLHAPLCQVFVEPFSKPWVLLADPIEAHDIMVRRPEFDRSEFITDGLSPMGSFHARMKTDATWRTTRSWLQDLISPSFLNNIVGPVLYESTTNLVKFWEIKARLADGLAFEVNDDLDHSALDGMLSFVFDRHFKHTALGPQIDLVSRMDPASMAASPKGEALFPKAGVHKFISALYETVDKIDVVTKAMSPRLAMWWIHQTPSYKRITHVKRQVVREQIQGALQRLEATGETKTAIEFMLAREKKAAEKQQRKPDFENPIMMDEVSRRTLNPASNCILLTRRVQIAGQFIAGLHTTSTTLAWTFIYLTRFPHIQRKLRDAMHLAYSDAHDQRRAPTLTELTKTRIPYLEAVLEEALRLHATSIARQATRDTELLGYHIPKGTNVVLIANGPGFHEPSFDIDSKLRSPTATKSSGWSDMNELNVFNPERWLVPKEGGRPEEFDFDANAVPQIAFGMGPRGCWGRRMAYLELRLVVSLTVWSFDFLEIPAVLADPKASYGIVHRADHCYLRMRSRSGL
jgi:hypothetical protein